MGLTKNYLKFAPAGVCNVIGSSWAGIELLPSGSLPGHTDIGTHVCVGACESLVVWDIRTGDKVKTLTNGVSMVTSIAYNGSSHLAVGYLNGSVSVFPLNDAGESVIFEGHQSSVACLAFDSDEGLRLASGGKDTDIIVWDIVSQRGLYRLKGHKNEVTRVRFVPKRNILVSSSRDTFVKFWDLDIQHCFKTITDHTSSVGDFIFLKDYSYMVTGSAMQDLKVWSLEYIEKDVVELADKRPRLETPDDENEEQQVKCSLLGTIPKECKEEILSMSTRGSLFGFHGNDKKLAVYRTRSDEEIEHRLKKRTKKLKKQLAENGHGQTDSGVAVSLTIDDLVVKLQTIVASFKIRAFQILEHGEEKAKIVALLKDNSIETYGLEYRRVEKTVVDTLSKFSLPGHRNEIRTLSFSSDSSAVMSGSSESIRIWNRSSLKCVRSFASGYTTSSAFVFGDRHVVVGTRSGQLEIYDIAAGLQEDSVDAHEGIVRTICLTTDKRGLASGGEDKQVLLWDFDYVLEEAEDETKQPRRKITVVPKKKVEMADVVLCVKYSNDMKYFVASLLNSKIYVFFADTMKLVWVLYDHDFAVTCIDISTDSQILISGSIDKSIHVYDLQFGQCLRFIKCAHDDRVNSVQFLPNTHLFFSSSHDGTVKQWDADTFQNVLILRGHHNNVTCLAVSPNGKFVASSATDKSLRLWEKTEEILVLDEEKEMERERELDDKEREDLVIPGERDNEAVIVGSKNTRTESSADKLIEQLIENFNSKESAKSSVKKPSDVLKQIPSSELEAALLLLPFVYVEQLLPILATIIEDEAEVELPWRCVMLLVRVHLGQITNNRTLLPVLEKLRRLRMLLKQEKELINFNRVGLLFLKQKLEDRDSIMLFSDVTNLLNEKKKRRRRKQAIVTIKA